MVNTFRSFYALEKKTYCPTFIWQTQFRNLTSTLSSSNSTTPHSARRGLSLTIHMVLLQHASYENSKPLPGNAESLLHRSGSILLKVKTM